MTNGVPRLEMAEHLKARAQEKTEPAQALVP